MNLLSHPIVAIIFDMDGLMLDTERMAQRAWQRAGAEFGYDFSEEIYLHAVGRTAPATEALFRQSFGPGFPFEQIYARKQEYLYGAIDREGIPTKPGLLELLEWLDQRQIAKAVATSTARPLAMRKLTAAKLLDRFSAIVCGNEVPNGKPAPDIFLAAAQLLDVAPDACIVLEDSTAGIKAAHAAGMQSIMVPDLIQPTAEITALADRVLPSLHQVLELLNHSSTD
ncbi:MAG: HAD family phosphatase [Caldilineaceae bacterium]